MNYLIALLLILPAIAIAQTIEKVGDKFVEVQTVTVNKELGSLADMRSNIDQLWVRKIKLEAERDHYEALIKEVEIEIAEIQSKFFEPVIEAQIDAEAAAAIAAEEARIAEEAILEAERLAAEQQRAEQEALESVPVTIPEPVVEGVNWTSNDVLNN